MAVTRGRKAEAKSSKKSYKAVTRAGKAKATSYKHADSKARISLPKTFANSAVVVDQVSDTEVRVRKAKVVPEDELSFYETSFSPLSDRDRDAFLALLENPPEPNKAFRQAAARYKSRHG
jgi:Protein of unknown function (DUF1778)